LKARAREALVESSFTDELFSEISERTNGDMTLAINVLRTAALKAQSEKRKKIEVSDLAEIPYRLGNPMNLSEDEKVILDILGEKKRLLSGELFVLYGQRAVPSKGERSFRNYIESLCAKGLVRAIGDKRGRVYEIVNENVERNDQT